MLKIIGIVEKSPLVEIEVPYLHNGGVDPDDGERKRPVVILNGRIFLQHASHVPAQRDIVAQQLHVVVCEAN
jgi:hypothetical protein